MADDAKLFPQSQSIHVLQSREYPTASEPHDSRIRPDLGEYRIMLVVMTIQTDIGVTVVSNGPSAARCTSLLPAEPRSSSSSISVKLWLYLAPSPPQTPRGVRPSIRRRNGKMLTETGCICSISIKVRPSILEMHGRQDTRGKDVHAWRSCLIASPRSGRVRSVPALRRAHQRRERREVR